MNYQEAREIVSYYAADLITFFSDHWGRFPVGDNADYVIAQLGEKQSMHESRGGDFSEKAADKINSLRSYLISIQS